ncbi:CSL zinc finger protein, partial [Lasiosphaeria miniovina]
SYYEVLGISPASLPEHGDDARSFIKRAYRRALLRHHPDKKKKQQQLALPFINQRSHDLQQHQAVFSVDQISAAYAVLSSPPQRAEYDQALRLLSTTSPSSSGAGTTAFQPNFQTGIENVDLDDLDSDQRGDGEQEWYRGCRCGNARGYLFGEADLEEAVDLGEMMVGCADCSLWLRVHFAVVDED